MLAKAPLAALALALSVALGAADALDADRCTAILVGAQVRSPRLKKYLIFLGWSVC